MNDEIVFVFNSEELEREKEAAEASRQLVWLSVRDLAFKLSVTERQVRRWQQRKRIPYHKVANRILFLLEEVEPALSRISHLTDKNKESEEEFFRRIGIY
jgi:hypothetical protein